jgi:hypothetical protein
VPAVKSRFRCWHVRQICIIFRLFSGKDHYESAHVSSFAGEINDDEKRGDRKSSPQTDMAWNDMKWCQLTCKKANLVWKSTKWMRLMRWMSECLVRKAELTKKKIPMKLCCAQKWWSGDLPVVNLGVFETRG